MPTVLITGANRGLGLEFARQYRADGWRVIGTCRTPDHAPELAAAIDPEPVRKLDVAVPGDADRLAEALTGSPIDLVIANAGVMDRGAEDFDLQNLDAWLEAFRTNTIGPFLTIRALMPNLAAAPTRVAAVLTSRMGSIADNTSGGYYAYRSSKAALNAVVKSLSIDLKHRGIIVTCFHPGWVRTAMGGPHAPLSAPDAVRAVRDRIAGLTPADSGCFVNLDGSRLPW